MDLNRLTTGEKIIGGCGIALLILAFFPWFQYDDDFVTAREGGFGNVFSALAILLGIAMAVIVIVKAAGKDLPSLPIAWPQAMLIAGGAAAALVLLQALVGSNAGLAGFSFDLDRAIGLWLGLLAAIGLAVGAFLNYQEGDAGGGSAPAGPPQSF